jgi:hypothetical protein
MKVSFFKYLFIFSVIGFIAYACVKKTTYPTTPEIEYSDFIPFVGDSADLKIKFTDGDGDIGVSGNDSTRNLWYTYSYLDTITLQYRAYTIYDPVTGNDDTLRNSYIIKAPIDSYKGKPISGEINVRLQRFRHIRKVKNLKYVFYLFDEAGNKSNVVTSPVITVQ